MFKIYFFGEFVTAALDGKALYSKVRRLITMWYWGKECEQLKENWEHSKNTIIALDVNLSDYITFGDFYIKKAD